MILVIGGTGVLGRRVLQHLRHTDLASRVLTRAPRQLQVAGVEVLAGDLTDAASLRQACAGATQVLAAAHGLLGRGRHTSERVDDAGHRALIDAARDAGVKRFVYVSILGASPNHPVDFWRTKHGVEQHLRASGLAHVILRPSAFMEMHAHELIGKAILAGGKARLIGPGTKPRNFVCAKDVAAAAVQALQGVFDNGTTLDLGGPGNFTNLEVAQLYAQACGTRLRTSHVPAGVARILARLIKPVHPGIARVLHLSSLADDAFDERFDSAALLARHPMTLTRLEDFVSEQVATARSRAGAQA